MPVKLEKLALSSSDLAPLSEESRRFLILACHIADELATLQKILVGCMQAKPASDIGAKAYSVQNLVIAKVLAGKLSEARQALDDYYFSGPSRDFDSSLPGDAKAALKDIKAYFGRKNLITTVRNEAAFHYGGGGIIAALSKVPAGHELLLFAGKESGNSLYYAAELVTTTALLDELRGGDDERVVFEKFISDVQVIARTFTMFLEGFIYAALMKAKGIKTEEVVVDAADTAKLDDQVIRYFLEK